MTHKPRPKQVRKVTIDQYNKSMLESPLYTPNRVLNMVQELFFGQQDVPAEYMCWLLDCDRCTLSKIVNKHQPMTPRLSLTIMDLTGWSRAKFVEYSGIQPYAYIPTKEQIEELLSRKSTLAKSLRTRNKTARRRKDQHPPAGQDADRGQLGLAQRAPSMESVDRC